MKGGARSFAIVGALGATIWGAPIVAQLEPVTGALSSVFLGAALAILVVGDRSPTAVALGALGALAYTALLPLSVAAAGGVLLAFLFGARALRAPNLLGQLLTAGLALGAGAAAAWIAWIYHQQSLGVELAAVTVGALIAAVPLLVPVDDRITFGLRGLAERASGTLKFRLTRAVVIRRRSRDVVQDLGRNTRKKMERAWGALLRAGKARLDAPRGNEVLDKRIAAYVSALQRASVAAGNASLISDDLDDAVLAELRLESDDLAAKADALAEVHTSA